MNPLDRLVKLATREWGKGKIRLDAFPGVATRLLNEFEYGWSLDQLDQELTRWFLKAPALPEQVSLHNTFGQPPVTLFNNGSCAVELYFWLTADTSIHSHGFRGAFRVLHGKSMQETFQVKVHERIAPGVMRCDPGVPEMTILEPGDVRTILPGEKLTHRVIHLEKPTVTLCVKTINEPDLYQWEYYPVGLAIQRHDLGPELIKQIYYFEYLLHRNAARAVRFLSTLVDSLSVVMRMTLYEALSGGAFDLSEDAIEHGLSQIRRVHGREGWFKRYESPTPPHVHELQFSGCDSPVVRLLAHFINGGHDPKIAGPHLSRLAGHDLTRREVQEAMSSLMVFEPVFGCDLSLEDRATIKHLVAHPGIQIPPHLEEFGQIRKMRDFVRRFGSLS